jgi:hypothetical protein
MPTAFRSSGGRPLDKLLALRAGLLATCVLALAPAQAQGQDNAAIDKLAKINKKAVDEYQNLNFEESRKLLQTALDGAAESGLESHPVTARTYVHMGVVLLAGFKQKDEAIKAFRKALQIQPDIKLDKSLATPEIQEVYDEAIAAQKAEPPKPAGDAIKHQPVAQSNRGVSIPIKAIVDGAKKVTLYFKADGADDFAEKGLREDPTGSGTWLGEIPGAATQGAALEYYLEATGADDGKLGSKGTSEEPLAVNLQGGRKKEPKPAPEPESPTWLIGLGFGSGVGWATGYGEVDSKDRVSPAGFAPSQLAHVVPEVGYFVSPTLLLSLQLRLQLVTGASTYHPGGDQCGDGVCTPAWYALAGLVRASYFLSEGDFRPYVAGVAGLGQIRHVAKFESVEECGLSMKETCIDTVAAGPVLVGGGGGFLYDVTPGFALTLGTNALIAFTTFTFHIDINAGVALSF